MAERSQLSAENLEKQNFQFKLQKKVLDDERQYLCENLEPEKLFPCLQSKRTLSTDDCELIRSFPTTTRKVEKLLDILKTSGPDSLRNLVYAIRRGSSTQKYIAEHLIVKYNLLKENPHVCDPPPPYTTQANESNHQETEANNSRGFRNQPSDFNFPQSKEKLFVNQKSQRSDSSASSRDAIPFQSMATSNYSQVTMFHPSDFPTSNVQDSIAVVDQHGKMQNFVESETRVMASILSEQSSQFEKHKSERGISRSRTPEENDASRYTQSSSWKSLDSNESQPVRREPIESECEVSDLEPSNFDISDVSTRSYLLNLPSDDSFEVSSGNI